MGDFNKFQNSFLYYSFYALLICIIASEVFIFLFTYQKGKGKAKKHYYDKGTKWLLYINFIICLYISVWFVSQSCPLIIRDKLFPYFFFICWYLVYAIWHYCSFSGGINPKKSIYIECSDN